MKPRSSNPLRFLASSFVAALALGAVTALLPASLSAAPSKITIGFDTGTEGFTGTNATGLAASGGILSGTATNGDPRIIKNSSTPVFSKPAGSSWQTIVFRVRETDESLAVVTPYSGTGVLVALNSANSGSGLTVGASYSSVDSGDGFITVTADISNFTADDIRYFRVDPIGGNDANGNLFEVDYIEITLTNTPPVLVSTIPVDDATGVAPSANLVATFDEPVFLGATGSITIKNLTNPSDTVISLPGPDPDGTVSVSGNELTIDPTVDLVVGDEYAIEISSDAIKDSDDVNYAGILFTDAPNWTFKTDDLPPVPDYFHPIAGSGNAPLDGALFIAFDESVLKGNGTLAVYKADNTLVETINVASGNVSVSDSTVTISPTLPLAHGTSYYILIDGGTFTDVLGNLYPGISNPGVWTFTTISNDPAVLFGDSFNRSNDADLNASAAGKYGSLGTLNYTSRVIGLGNVQLSNGQLLAQGNEPNGNSGGLVYINDHNFSDTSISVAGGFSITVDLNAYSTQGTGRYLSVGVGQSLAELDAQSTATTSGSAGDLVVAYRYGTGNLEFFKNGVRDVAATTSGQPSPPTKMRIDYSLSDFSMGSTVNYSVFFDNSAIAITMGSFIWSGTGENYISLASNAFFDDVPGTRNALFDNLQIRTNAASSSAYDAWANGEAFDTDANGDGVKNGLAFLLGAAGPDANALGKLPTATQSGGLVLTFNCLTGANRGDAVLSLEQSSDLGISDPWTEVPVPLVEGVSDVGSLHFEVTSSGGLLHVVATISSTEAPSGKLFSRLKGTR